MAATYKQFLASPSSALLAENASLHYVTTLTSFVGAAEIIKHLGSLQRQVKKKEEILNVIDGQSIIAVEVDTHIEFITSGGVYLPGLDDNFLSDREAFLPIVSCQFKPNCRILPSHHLCWQYDILWGSANSILVYLTDRCIS